jgi:hypothetical protein
MSKLKASIVPFLVSLSFFSLPSCSDDESEAGGGSDSQGGSGAEDSNLTSEVLANFSSGVLLPSLEDFAEKASQLNQALTALDKLEGSALDDAQAAFATAFDRWQLVEMMKIGPLAAQGISAASTADDIYWANENTCSINKLITVKAYESEELLKEQNPTTRSLSAIEYLLYYSGRENDCSPLTDINAKGLWDELSDEEIAIRRLAYVKKVGELLEANAQAALATYGGQGSFEADQTNFAEEIANAGASESVYADRQEALNTWSEALFAIDTETKDSKLGAPAGISECLSDCPVESRFAGLSLLALQRNLESFDLQFFGGVREGYIFGSDAKVYPTSDAPGFDDLLIDVDEQEIVDEMAEKLDIAHASFAKVSGTLADAIADGDPEVEQAHSDLSAVVTLFKTDVFAVLNIELPNRQSSDTD